MERAKKEFCSLSPDNTLFFLIVLFLPTQFGRHFWPNFSIVSGLRIDYLSPTLYLTDVLIFLLFIFWLLSLRELKIKLPVVIFSIFLLIGIFLSRAPLAGLYGFLKLAELCFFGFYTAKNIKQMKLVVIALSVGVFFESFLAVAQYLKHSSIGSVFYFFGERTFNSQTPGIANASLGGSLVLRPYGTFSHPNVLAGYLVVSMSIVLFFKLSKLVKSVIFLIGTVALFLTLGRTAIIVWIIICLLYLFWKSWKAIVPAVILVIFVLYLSPLYLRFAGLGLADEAVISRVELSKSAVEMFVIHPVLGVGLNNFLPNLPSYLKASGNVFYIQPVHNVFLLILSETGSIGLGFFLWFLVKTYKRILNKKNLLAFTALSAVIVLGFFDHYFLTLQQGQLLFALVLGICWSARSDTIS